MQIIYATEPMPKRITKSIFLAGPTPRNEEVEGWREDALNYLNSIGFNGTVFVPEPKYGVFGDYTDQIEWEHKFLNAADLIVFWIPRDLSLDSNDELRMPAFTTNIEFGMYHQSHRIVVGFPKNAPHTRYIEAVCNENDVPVYYSLESLLDYANETLQDNSRVDGECYVPALLWKAPEFQHWYKQQKSAGNVLCDLKIEYNFYMPRLKKLFLWIAKVDVFITSEQRHKDIEFVLSRSDLSSVVLYYNDEIVLVKEFRSPCCNDKCFVYEIPGGSAHEEKEPKITAFEEVQEETGIQLDINNLKYVNCRQAMATLSAHRIHLFSYKLTKEQMDEIKKHENDVHGLEEDTERTYIVVKSLKEILSDNLLDWNNIGMILEAINE